MLPKKNSTIQLIPSREKRQTNQAPLFTQSEVFFPELKFIEREDAFPGAFSPEVDQPLVFNDQRSTPVIPLNPLLLDYFTPEELLTRIQFQTVTTEEGIRIRLILNLPLSGVKQNQEVENYSLVKDYELKEENSLGDQLPVLQIWPNFRKQDWHEYYIFYYDGELAERTFKINYPQAKQSHDFKEGFGTFSIYRLEEFPEYLTCTDFFNNEIGLILFPSPPKIRADNHWQVGVDFNSSFTNVYLKINNREVTQPLELKNLQLQITNTSLENRLNALFEYFIPELFQLVSDSKPLPIASVLTTRGKDPNNYQNLSPILDVRFILLIMKDLNPRKTGLKLI